MRLRLSVLALACALSHAALADQVVPISGKTPVVKARAVNPRSFSPMIDRSVRSRPVRIENELKFDYPIASEKNSIPVGGTLKEYRVATRDSAYFPTNGFTQVSPPDPDLAVSTKGVVAVVNDTIGFYTRTGTQTFLQPLDKFFPGAGPFQSDPKVNFDPDSGRFFVVYLDIAGLVDTGAKGSSFLIAVSNSDDPLGGWKTYKVSNLENKGGNDYWLDYPGWGFNKDAIVASGNMYPFASGTPYPNVYVFKKSDLINGTAQATKFSPDGFTVQIAKGYDASPYVYAVSTRASNQALLYAIDARAATPTLVTAPVLIPDWTHADKSLNVGPGGIVTEVNDPRMLNSAYRAGRLVSSHSVGVSASDRRGAARWYDFATNGWPASGSPTLTQSGQLDPPTNYSYSFPAINLNPVGDLAMTFSRISPIDGYKVMATGRKPTDAKGAMGTPTVLETGLKTTYDFGKFSDRWGDYFDVEVDPKDNRTFWAIGEATAANGNWQTFVKSFAISVGEDTATVVNAQSATPFTGTLRSGTNVSLFAADANSYNLRSQAIAGIGQSAGVQATFKSPILPGTQTGQIGTLKAVYAGTGPVNGTTTLFLKNVSTGQLDPVATFPASDANREFNLSTVASTYVGTDGSIVATLRTVLPPRNGRTAVAFDVSYNRLAFFVIPIIGN